MENDNETKHVLLKTNGNEKKKAQLDYNNFYLSKRFTIVIFIFIADIFLISLRTNLSMAIVEMTTKKNVTVGNTTVEVVEFAWDSKQKAISLSAFSYGYLLCPVGGVVASRFGGATVLGIGVFFTALTTLLTPFLVRINFYLFVLSRIIEGVFESFAMASIPEIWSRWAPREEVSTMSGLTGTGFHFGSMISFPLAGFIAKHWGWPAIFYVTGAVPLIWSLFWFIFFRNDPAIDRFISEPERLYLKEKINRKIDEKVKYSWKSILMSKPVWAICVTKLVYSCGYTFMIMYLPLYIRDTSNVDIKNIGLISALPHFCSSFGHPFFSYLADYLRNSGKMSATQVHKFYNALGYFCGAALFIVTIYTDAVGSIISLSLLKFFQSGAEIVFGIVVLDLAPRYASLLFGMTNEFFTLGTILCPTLAGYIVTTHSVSEWNICFMVFSGVYVFGGVFFLIFGSGKLQPWAIPKEERLENKDQV